MAYAYSAIDNLLDDQKQDIFGGNGAQGQGNNGAQGQPEVKTSTEGEIGTNPQSSAPQAGSALNPQADTEKANRAAYTANAGKTAIPADIPAAQQQLTQNSQRLQNEANSYVTKQEGNQNYGVDQAALDSAISGDNANSDKVRGLLNNSTINQVDDFTPSNLNVQDVGLLGSNAGLQKLVSRGKNPNYTQGQAAFDVNALKSSPGFQNLINMVQSQQSGLNKQAQDLADEKKKEIATFGKSALGAAQKNAKDYLGGKSSEITKALKDQADAENAKLAALRTSGDADAESKALKDATDSAEARLAQVSPRALEQLKDTNLNARDYETVRGDYTPEQLANAEQAQRFNQISGLLGQSGKTLAAGQGVGSPLSFDQTKLQNDLTGQALTKRAEVDKGLSAQEKEILDAAQARAEGYDSFRRSDRLVGNEAAIAAQKALSGYGQDYQDQYTKGQVNPLNYLSLPQQRLNYNDVLNSQEVGNLNDLNSQLGLQNRYQIGSYNPDDRGYNFDQQGYINALTSKVLAAQRAADDQKKYQQEVATYNGPRDPNSLIINGAPIPPDADLLHPVDNPYGEIEQPKGGPYRDPNSLVLGGYY